MDLLFTLAQSVPDATQLAEGDAQKVLAYVVAALVLAVLGLFAMLTKVVLSQKDDIKELHSEYGVKILALEEKNDKLSERLLRYVANINSMLAGQTGSTTDPLDNGGPV